MSDKELRPEDNDSKKNEQTSEDHEIINIESSEQDVSSDGESVEESSNNLKLKSNIIISSLNNLKSKFEFNISDFKIALKRYWGLTLKELKVLINDKIAMLVAFALPITIIFLIVFFGGKVGENSTISTSSQGQTGFQGRGSIPNNPPIIGLIDYDKTNLSSQFVALVYDYQSDGYCTVIQSDNQSYLEELLGTNKITSIIVIPPLFEYNLSIHFPAIINVIIDTIDTTSIQSSQEVINKIINEFKFTHGYTGVFNLSFIEEGVPEKGKVLFVTAPIFFPMILFSIASLTATQSIVSDIPKDRMVLTPTNKYEMLAAKMTALQIIMVGIITETVLTSMALGLTIRGNVFGFFGALFFVSLSGVVTGLAVSTFAEVPLDALQYFTFIFLFQSIILLFLSDVNILRWIPIWDGDKLLMNVTLRGEPLAWNIHYLYNIVIETIIIYIITQLVFNKRKNML
ncbi:MAG: ABC transporter permease [Promethearchaeota archaeon]